MTLIAEIEQGLKQARLDRDDDRRDALSLLLSALRSAEKDLQRPLSDDESLQVLQRERKKRVEALEAYVAAGRDEQAAVEQGELDVIEEYMPEQLSDDELDEIVDDVIAEVGATSLRDIGRVMADVMPRISGRADGSAVSQIVREKLAQPERTPGCRHGRIPPGGPRPVRGSSSTWRTSACRRSGAWIRCTCAHGRP